MFENTLSIVDDCGLTYLHVFPFSPRPGTPAARMPQLDRRARQGARRSACARRAKRRLPPILPPSRAPPRRVLIERDGRGRTEHFTEARSMPASPARSLLPASPAARDRASSPPRFPRQPDGRGQGILRPLPQRQAGGRRAAARPTPARQVAAPAPRQSWFQKLKSGLSRSSGAPPSRSPRSSPSASSTTRRWKTSKTSDPGRPRRRPRRPPSSELR